MMELYYIPKAWTTLTEYTFTHRFPKNPDRRKLWFGLVGISESQPLPKYPELCSDHFYPGDMVVRRNGLKYVKKDANPRRSEGLLFLDDVSNSTRISNSCMDDAIESSYSFIKRENEGISNSCMDDAIESYNTSIERENEGISNSCMDDAIESSYTFIKIENEGISNSCMDDGIESSYSFIKRENEGISNSCMDDAIESSYTFIKRENEGFEDISPVPTISGIMIKNSEDSSSATEPALQIIEIDERHNDISTTISPDSRNVNGKKRKRCYVGDMTSDDFSTPEKVQKNVDILKNTVFDQRKKIHTLQMKVRRLKNRVTSLTTLIKDLKKKITDNRKC